MFSPVLIGIMVLSLVPVLFWMGVYLDREDRTKDQIKLLVGTFAYGILAVIPFLFIREFLFEDPSYNFILRLRTEIPNSYLAAFLTYSFVAVLEEYIKHFGFIVMLEKSIFRLKKIIHGIEFSVASGLGFAFIENIVYLSSIVHHGALTGDFVAVFAIRSIGATLAHTVFSGMFGYFYARAKLLPHAVIKEQPSVWNLNSLLWQGLKFELQRVQLILRNKATAQYERGGLIFTGFLLAALLHLAYNFLISVEIFNRNLTFLTVPLVFLAFFYLISRRKIWINRRIIKTFEAVVAEGKEEAKQKKSHLPNTLSKCYLRKLLKHYDAHIIEGLLNELGHKYHKESFLRRLDHEISSILKKDC
ncbi:MAG: PrsW family glutamic-type intramembrane protease [Candidatus Gracilibacteria bacterium]|nr:PrsW family glutamic-type intramembrane protease [Candidatus Gracilibacteria bacterium]